MTCLTPKLILATALAGCAAPALPVDPRSPASTAAKEAPPMSLTTALDEDPPLPGGDLSRWRGLSSTSTNAEHHHHHDGGHDGH
jgi:hypothetical protein